MDNVVIDTLHKPDHQLWSFMVREAKIAMLSRGTHIFPWSFQLDLFYMINMPTRMHHAQISQFSGSFIVFGLFCVLSRSFVLIIQVRTLCT